MKILALLLLVFFSPTYAKTITTCLDYTPHMNINNGAKKWSGPNIETLHHIAKQLSMELDTTIRAPFARCMVLLKTGEIDIVAGLINTEERAKLFHMLPYGVKNQLAIFHLKANKNKFNSLNQLKDLIIGMHRAFALPDNIKQSALFQHLTPIASVKTGLRMTLKGRIDGVLATIATGKTTIDKWPELHYKFSFTPVEVDKEISKNKKIYLAISRKSSLSEHLSKIRRIIKRLAENPELQHLHIKP